MATPAQIESYKGKLAAKSNVDLVNHVISVGTQLGTANLGTEPWESALAMVPLVTEELLRRMR